MIREHHQAEVIICSKSFQQYTYDKFIYQFDGPDLVFDFEPVSALVRGFNMDIDEIFPVLKLLQGRFGFSSEISIYIACSTGNIDGVQPGTDTYAFYEIHG